MSTFPAAKVSNRTQLWSVRHPIFEKEVFTDVPDNIATWQGISRGVGDGLSFVASMATLSNPAVLRRQVSLRGIVQGVGFRPLHSAVPPNDGGIALGQSVIANEILNSGA
jgi:hypothetical protein